MPEKFDHRAFIRLDQGYDENPKIAPLSDAAFRAHVESVCWSSRIEGNGLVTASVAAKKWRKKVVQELVDAHLFDEVEGGYLVHDYLDFQRSSDEIASYRESRGTAGTLGNHKRWHVARRKVDPECEHCQKGERLGIAK